MTKPVAGAITEGTGSPARPDSEGKPLPQLNLVTEQSVPWRLVLTVQPATLTARDSLLTAEVYNHDNGLIGRIGGRYVGMMTDYLPSAAQAAVEAYLWGDNGEAVMKAVRRVRLQAVKHRLEWLTTHTDT